MLQGNYLLRSSPYLKIQDQRISDTLLLKGIQLVPFRRGLPEVNEGGYKVGPIKTVFKKKIHIQRNKNRTV